VGGSGIARRLSLSIKAATQQELELVAQAALSAAVAIAVADDCATFLWHCGAF